METQQSYSGAPYNASRAYTDKVHKSGVLQEVYEANHLFWVADADNPDDLARIRKYVPNYNKEEFDCEKVVDYVGLARNKNTGKVMVVFIQERFRTPKFDCYKDFTLRYRRDHTRIAGQQESEAYKLVRAYRSLRQEVIPGTDFALVMLYGVASEDKAGNITGLSRWVFADLSGVAKGLAAGRIRIGNQNESTNQVAYAELHENGDESSSFIALRVSDLDRLFGVTGWRRTKGNW